MIRCVFFLFVASPAWFWYNGREAAKRIWTFQSAVIAASKACYAARVR